MYGEEKLGILNLTSVNDTGTVLYHLSCQANWELIFK